MSLPSLLEPQVPSFYILLHIIKVHPKGNSLTLERKHTPASKDLVTSFSLSCSHRSNTQKMFPIEWGPLRRLQSCEKYTNVSQQFFILLLNIY